MPAGLAAASDQMATRNEPNRIVEEQLDVLIRDLEKAFAADLLSYCGPIEYGTDDLIRDAVESRAPKRDKLVVVLETPGGLIETVQRIAELFRHHYPQRVEFVVPNYAMSAGTVLVMSGDAIHMDYYSILGPIDPQIERLMPDGPRLVPALGYLHKYNELVQKSLEGKLSTVETVYFTKRFDPAELYDFAQARELSKTLLREWLANYKFKDWNETETKKTPVTQQMREDRATEIATFLNDTERWHSHGRGISMAVLRKDLMLKIDDFGADVTLNAKIRSYHKALTHYMMVLGFGSSLHTPGRLEQGR